MKREKKCTLSKEQVFFKFEYSLKSYLKKITFSTETWLADRLLMQLYDF